MISNDPISKALAFDKKINRISLVRIPGIRGLFRKIYFKMRSKNSDLDHFYVKMVMQSQEGSVK